MMKQKLWQLAEFAYRQPLVLGMVLSILTSCYLIADYQVVNASAMSLLWELSALPRQVTDEVNSVLGQLIIVVGQTFGLSAVSAGYLMMVVCHAVLTGLMLLIARRLSFSLMSQWALLVVLLSHPNYNDFRSYIIAEPLFWVCWLLAIYILLCWYRKHTVIAIALWLMIFLVASQLSVAAWFWLLLFPFGALFWRPWRRKSVAYALVGYAMIVAVLLMLPLYESRSPIAWFIETVVRNPNLILDALSLSDSNWMADESYLMSGVFVLSGATSLMLVRTLIAFGIVCVLLALFALKHKRYRIIEPDLLRIIGYAIGFDIFIAVMLLVLGEDDGSVLAFSTSFLLFFFAALGLSFIAKNTQEGRYSRMTVLVAVWCFVAYLASGFIIFGPRKTHIKIAGQESTHLVEQNLYSNSEIFLFYTKQNPKRLMSPEQIERLRSVKTFYYAYEKNRHRDLPSFLAEKTPLEQYRNRRGDQLLVYDFSLLKRVP